MIQVNLKELIGRLNPICKRTLEAAAGACLSLTHYNVEIEHWLLKLLEVPNTDLVAIFKHFRVDTDRLVSDLSRTTDRFKTGNSRAPALSPALVDLTRNAWLIGSVDFGERTLRSGHLLLALLMDDPLNRNVGGSNEWQKISPEVLHRELLTLVSDTEESGQPAETTAGGGTSAPAVVPSGPTKTPSLDQYTIDLTAQARAGKIDPVLGRDPEIRQIIDILTRRRQNNPILTGEAGVGKTAVVEGFALRIAAGDVPPSLQKVSLRTLDLGLLQAGAGVKGEFENRLKGVINEVKSSPQPIILFIDEAHTMIGAGGQAGQGDAANLLKPALARGELRTIAATTWAEYTQYFERDAALARRFQVVKVEEPLEKTAVEMMRGLSRTLEKHHRVRILNEAIVDAVRLSSRYITGRQLPDKAVSVLDTTSARIGISQAATPPSVEDCRRRIDQLRTALAILEREANAGANHDQARTETKEQLVAAENELQVLDARWQKEKESVARILQLHEQLESANAPQTEAVPAGSSSPATAPTGAAAKSAPAPAASPLSETERAAVRSNLEKEESALKSLQGDSPLVHVCVDSQAIAATVSAWTGVPLRRMVADEVRTIRQLRSMMEESIVGQGHALEAIAARMRISRAQLGDPRTPVGVFLLVGTSGTGKTETAITLANLLYGGEQNMTVLNMSEFKEEHKVSLLMGAPPGYKGYGEGGVLTEAVRRKPYSVVLLDEMEKAHHGVQDVFYQVFDKGIMKDGTGRDIDFKNTVILMTTNACSDQIKNLCSDPATCPDAGTLTEALFPELVKTFKPAFLGRLSIVPYFPLSDEVMRRIVELKLGKIGRRVRDNYRAKFEYTPDLVDTVAKRCTEVDTGARNIDHILNGTLLPELADQFLARMGDGHSISQVKVTVGSSGNFAYEIA